MNKEVKIKPKNGLIVRDPITFFPLPESGTVVSLTGKVGSYYKRRISCGDVEVIWEEKGVKEKGNFKSSDYTVEDTNE